MRVQAESPGPVGMAGTPPARRRLDGQSAGPAATAGSRRDRAVKERSAGRRRAHRAGGTPPTGQRGAAGAAGTDARGDGPSSDRAQVLAEARKEVAPANHRAELERKTELERSTWTGSCGSEPLAPLGTQADQDLKQCEAKLADYQTGLRASPRVPRQRRVTAHTYTQGVARSSSWNSDERPNASAIGKVRRRRGLLGEVGVGVIGMPVCRRPR